MASDTDKKTEEQYLVLLGMFRRLLDGIGNGTMDFEMLEDIIDRRSYFMFGFCAERFNLDIDDALNIVREGNERVMDPFERSRRKCLVAAIDNLIDFSVAAEAQMYMDLENGEDEDPEDTFKLYNETYARVENDDVSFTAGMASSFISFPEYATIMYMTQGDERVRDSHRALEGLSFPKYAFPEGLIPPIDWRCRCYLMETYSPPNYSKFDDYEGKIEKAVNPVFKESLAVGGRIFGQDHPYFTIDSRLRDPVLSVSSRLKNKYDLP